MGFSVEVDYLLVSRAVAPGGAVPYQTQIPADKTTLSPPKLKRNWDVKPGFGVEGASAVYTGGGLATFDATFEFWNEERERDWNIFAGAFLTSPAGKPAALGIYHPVLIQPPFHIQNVVVTDVEGWSLVTPGRWQTRVSFLQFNPPKQFTPAKTEPAVPATEKKPPERPATMQQKNMANRAARLQWVGAHRDDSGFKPPYPEAT